MMYYIVIMLTDGTPPDGTPVDVIHPLSVLVITIQSLMTGILLVAVVVASVVNTVFRKRK